MRCNVGGDVTDKDDWSCVTSVYMEEKPELVKHPAC